MVMNTRQKQELGKIIREVEPYIFTSETQKGGTIHLAQDNYKEMEKQFQKVFKKIIRDGFGSVTFKKNGLHIGVRSVTWYLPWEDYMKYGTYANEVCKFHVIVIDYSIKKRILGTLTFYRRINK